MHLEVAKVKLIAVFIAVLGCNFKNTQVLNSDFKIINLSNLTGQIYEVFSRTPALVYTVLNVNKILAAPSGSYLDLLGCEIQMNENGLN